MSARYCDIVMKGGITSGVVYPSAVVEIAKNFVFRNVGGTSAGAIAASLTAAAEYRRQRDGSEAGFERLAGLPDWLAAGNLERLFAPNRATRSLFRTVFALASRKGAFGKMTALSAAYPLQALAGTIPAVLLAVAAIANPRVNPFWRAMDIVAILATLIVFVTLATGLWLWRDLRRELPPNLYGLCSGVDDANPKNETALSVWLARELELTAGLAPGIVPLTFGMLWDAAAEPPEPAAHAEVSDPVVRLQVIATNLSHGRPHIVPFTTDGYLYDPAEFAKLFPAHVVAWLARRSPEQLGGLRALPPIGDLPVIVAARMSLAFPFLLSAVPLYVSATQGDIGQARTNDAAAPEKCWFSDGGISSNFPVTLFDAPLPRWPTFAIDLEAFGPGQCDDVSMPANNEDGTKPTYGEIGSVSGFAEAIANTMQNWADNAQMRIPGYRDRVVTVRLHPSEGGLNLDMPPEIVRALSARGTKAGRMLVERFAAPSTLDPKNVGMNWENQRWVRYRTNADAFARYLGTFLRAFTQPEPPDVGYPELIASTQGTPAAVYPFPASSRAADVAATDDLAALARHWEAEVDFATAAPQPAPVLVDRPRL
ncbi:MAG: hypothetical protein ACREM2_02085 [Vulcanimicrobiaceae bacterium]